MWLEIWFNFKKVNNLVGGHGDVKQENFVVSRDQDSNADVINVKLIDFNLSVLYGVFGFLQALI